MIKNISQLLQRYGSINSKGQYDASGKLTEQTAGQEK